MRALHWLPTISLRALLNGAAAAHTFLGSPLFVLRAPSSRAEVFLACHLANHSGTPVGSPFLQALPQCYIKNYGICPPLKVCGNLFVQGSLAYPVRAEATKHVLPGRKSPGCPAVVRAAVGTAWGATQNWRPEHKEISAAPKSAARTKSFQADYFAGSRPSSLRGRPMTQRKKQARARCGTAGVWDPASKERFSEITSGRSGGHQGLVTTCEDSSNEANKPK